MEGEILTASHQPQPTELEAGERILRIPIRHQVGLDGPAAPCQNRRDEQRMHRCITRSGLYTDKRALNRGVKPCRG